ncbi:MAG: cupredoxin domain-containing protein [Chloroflexi bacterium]|nr:cupredoxin domain-containing protein [Chloroflexota bacterium]
MVMLGALAATLALLLSVAGVAAAGGTVDILEEDERYSFEPGEITVAMGETVTWQNGSDAPHTVTSDTAGGPLDSPELAEDDSYQETFDTAGDYAYHCEIHDYMQGVVHVVDMPPTDALGAVDDSGRLPAPLMALVALLAAGVAGSLIMFRLRKSPRTI